MWKESGAGLLGEAWKLPGLSILRRMPGLQDRHSPLICASRCKGVFHAHVPRTHTDIFWGRATCQVCISQGPLPSDGDAFQQSSKALQTLQTRNMQPQCKQAAPEPLSSHVRTSGCGINGTLCKGGNQALLKLCGTLWKPRTKSLTNTHQLG